MRRRAWVSSRRSRRGMTLIEVLVALAILVVMAAVSWDVLSSSIELNQLLARSDDTNRSARLALSKLRRQIQLAYLTRHKNAIETYETVFVGLDDNPDTVYFATLGHERIYADSRECDQSEVTVWGESSPEERGGRGDVIYHRESPRIDHEPDEEGRVWPLAYDVRSFNLRYLDSARDEWVDEWDTRSPDTPDRLPRAVEIGLVLISPDPFDEDDTVDVPFYTTVMLEHADSMPSLFDPDMEPNLEGDDAALGAVR